MNRIGIVAIGRNEGKRLIRSLDSLRNQLPQDVPIVYVDSGSTDGSCQAARDRQVEVINLDLSISFTAARSRNTGFKWLCANCPQIEYVQFLDGDCEIIEGWIEKAIQTLDSEPSLAIVCGRRKERFPDASPYNLLADMEWNTPVGEAKACGGDAMMRVSAIQQVNGYNDQLICGEEPEMCIRLRRLGWKIWRLDADMTLHDAAMLKFSQWWKRSVRGGWATAQGAAMYGSSPEKYKVREQFSGWLWGVIIPLLSLGLALPTSGLSLLLLMGYPLMTWRIYQNRRKQGESAAHAWLYARYFLPSKLAQAIGQSKYWLNRLSGKQPTLIEYKTAMPQSKQT